MAHVPVTLNSGENVFAYDSDIDLVKRKVKYFQVGKGWVKTQFKNVITGLPDIWDKLTWLEICKIAETYGLELATTYAERKVAGYIASRQLAGKYAIYTKIKDVLTDNNSILFEYLDCNFTLAVFGMYVIDIVEFDSTLNKIDPDYNGSTCTYKDQTNVSISEYVKIKYGQSGVDLINTLIEL